MSLKSRFAGVDVAAMLTNRGAELKAAFEKIQLRKDWAVKGFRMKFVDSETWEVLLGLGIKRTTSAIMVSFRDKLVFVESTIYAPQHIYKTAKELAEILGFKTIEELYIKPFAGENVQITTVALISHNNYSQARVALRVNSEHNIVVLYLYTGAKEFDINRYGYLGFYETLEADIDIRAGMTKVFQELDRLGFVSIVTAAALDIQAHDWMIWETWQREEVLLNG